MDTNVWTVVGVALIGVGVYAGLMTMAWSLCVMAARADKAAADACARDEEQRRRLAVVPRGPR